MKNKENGVKKMGFLDNLKNFVSQPKTEEALIENTKTDTVYAPIKGEIIPISDIADGVFSEEVLGHGCGIKPSEGKMFAPVTGKVIQVAETKHAVGFLSDDGIELLVHVGMDTVDMNGKGFTIHVKEGDRVTCGQHIMDFSIADIKQAGHVTTTAVVVTNSDDYKEVKLNMQGEAEKSAEILNVQA